MIGPLYSADILSRSKDISGQDAAKKAAKEIESFFLYEMIKVMRESADLSSETGFGSSVYTGMFDMEVARVLAERGMGLQDVLLRGLDRAGAYKNASSHSDVEADAPSVPSGIVSQDAKARVSSHYGPRTDPFDGTERFHHGLDIAVPEGTEIRPVLPGKVVYSGEQNGYGNVVVIEHGEGMVTVYAHNKENLVKPGDIVQTSTVIAKAGSTGRATGPHLHFEVRMQGRSVDPSGLLAGLKGLKA